MKKTRLRMSLIVLGTGLMLPSLAGAADATATSSAPKDVVSSSNVLVVDGSATAKPTMSAGMVIAIDPVTGERRAPRADEQADLSAASRFGEAFSDGASLHQFSVEGGGVGLLLDSRYVISETISLKDDGTRSGDHQTGIIPTLDALRRVIDTASLATEAPETGTTDTTGIPDADADATTVETEVAQ